MSATGYSNDSVVDRDAGEWGASLWKDENNPSAPPEPLPWCASSIAHFEAGLCGACGVRMHESSPGWVRCPTSYASGPRSNGSDPVEYQLRFTPDRRARFVIRRCPNPESIPFPGVDAVAAVPPGVRPLPASMRGALVEDPRRWIS